MLSRLDVGTVSLKFWQFKSAVCDAFCGGFVFLRICGGVVCLFGVCGGGICFVRCWDFRATCFWPLYCWVDGWGLVIWLNMRLLVVDY